MKNNFKIILTISVLLVALSFTISLINFMVSLKTTHQALAERSLPLSVDNIYSEIHSHIIEPNLVSSMMANDTFVRDWLIHEEQNHDKITQFLTKIKNKYGLYVTFLASDLSLNYYTHNGLLETLSQEKADNQWYFRFRESEVSHEVNLDTNSQLDNTLFMFMNYKIFDENYQLIGATGVGHRISYVDDMFKRFRQQYKFKVYFVDKTGKIVLSESLQKRTEDLSTHPALGSMYEQLITRESKVIDYQYQGEELLVKTKYVPELGMYLLVEAKLDDFTQEVKKTLYINLAGSLLVTVIVILLVLMTIRGYNKKLEFLATKDALTELLNRRAFEGSLRRYHSLSIRNQEPLSIIFFDIDDFKEVNDKLGHSVGDQVLKRIALILKAHFRADDLVARWGGEEFVIALLNSNYQNSQKMVEKLRGVFEQDIELLEAAKQPVTASFGISLIAEKQSIEEAVSQADQAMYCSKARGKNRITLATDI